MILWQKQATARWLATNEPQLEKIAGRDLAVITRPERMRNVVQVACRSRAKAARLLRVFGGVAQPLPRGWRGNYQPQKSRPLIRIGRRLKIVSDRSAARRTGSKCKLIIPAAGAFGTGDHVTTAMCLRLLEETTRGFSLGWRLLDAGTGTGILALAACRLGASEVLGIDNDPRAIAHARQNARLNQISGAKFRTVDLLKWKPRCRYAIIAANLFSEILLVALPLFRRALRAHGRVILSGILREQADCVGFVSQARFPA